MKNRNRVFAAGALLVFLLSTLFFWKINPASALTEAWIDEAELGQMCIRQVIPSAGKLETAENTETNDGQDNKLDADKADSDAAKEDKSDGGCQGVRRSAGDHLSYAQYRILYAV